MRILFFLLGSLLLSHLVGAQFFVIKVNEQVFADGQLLKPRARVSPDAQLQFSSKEAYAHVLSTSKGHFVISGEKSKKNKKGEFFIALKEAIIPSDQFLAAATRAGSMERDAMVHLDDKYDIKAFFRETIVILDSLSFQLDPEKFPLDDQRYFTIIQQKADTVQRMRLKARKQTFSLTSSLFQGVKDRMPASETPSGTLLCYVDETKNERQEFGPFEIYVLSQEERNMIRGELICMQELLSLPSESEFIQLHAIPYLYGYYGKMNVADIKELIQEEEK